MRKWLLPVVALLVLSTPTWSLDKSFNGSVAPLDDGWEVWDNSASQGSLFDEGGDNSSWFINDAANLKTKYRINQGSPAPIIQVNPDTGAYIESRIKCTNWNKDSGGDDTPLNLGLQIYYTDPVSGTYRSGHWVTVRPDRLMMRSSHSKPVTYGGTFTDYRTIRLVYKRLDLRARAARTDAYAAYLDGDIVPVLHSWTNSTAKDWGGPTWGAGNTGNVQDVYFDWINYTDAGAYPPGMDGTVQFANGDPDGAADPNGQGFTITWQTNVPTTGEIRYSIDGDNSFSGVAHDTQNPALSTSHSVTITGATPGATYEYFAISTDASGGRAISLPANIALPNPFYISAAPACAPAADGLSATVTWGTNIADASSEVHYGLDQTCSQVVVEPGSGGLTAHSVAIPTEPNRIYYYYVKSYHATWPSAQSSVRSFNTYVLDEALDNPGFEDGVLEPWVKFGPFTGIMNSTQWAVPAHSGARWAGSVASYGRMDLGGLYQKVVTTPGRFYEGKVWIWVRHEGSPSAPGDVACRIGIDPTGGALADSTSIIWSDWTETPNANTDGGTGPGGPWTEIGVAAKAVGPEATLFVQQTHHWGLAWNIDGFDDASWEVAPPPPGDIPGTKRLKNGYPVQLEGKVVTGAFMDPMTLETFFYIEEADRTTGIRVNWGGPVSPGELRDVSGTITSINNERVVIADAVGPDTPAAGEVPGPAAINNRSITSSYGYLGPNYQGLLIRTWGRITYREAGMIYVDDGTNYFDGSTYFFDVPVTGIRVYSENVEAYEGQYVYVTGCLGNVLYTPTVEPPRPAYPIPAVWATEVVVIPE